MASNLKETLIKWQLTIKKMWIRPAAYYALLKSKIMNNKVIITKQVLEQLTLFAEATSKTTTLKIREGD